MLATERECSQSTVKGKKGNESMWVGERWGESTLYSPGCQFTSKPSQPPQTSQSCLKGCYFGCRVPTTTYRQTEWVWDLPDESTCSTKLYRLLSFWHSAPYMNSAGLNLKANNKTNTTYIFPTVIKLFDISHNLFLLPFLPFHSMVTFAFLQCLLFWGGLILKC